MAAAGTPPPTTRSPAPACKAWGTFGCTSTGGVTGRVKTISVKREGWQWYVILACDEVPAEPLPATGAVSGIDMGIAHFLTTAKGEHKPNPRHGKRTADALADAQRAVKAFPRCKRDNRTARHRRAVEKVATLHRTVRRQRQDHAHKPALAIVGEYDVIAHERLSIANMVRAPQPKPDPGNAGAFLPNGAAAKAGGEQEHPRRGLGGVPGHPRAQG